VTAAGVAVLCLLPAVVAAWPVRAASGIGPAELRDRVLASVNQPYSGYVTTDGRLRLPELPALEDVRGVFSGSARLRAWYASSAAWRVAELTATGERDTYRTVAGQYTWDYERNLVTELLGDPSVWLPGTSDVVPPVLARRLLGAGGDVSALPARRVAGVEAAGLRLTPDDPDTSIAWVDVWADPRTGLPVHVEVVAEGATDPVFTSRFLDVDQAAPDPATLTPAAPPGAGFARTTPADAAEALGNVLNGQLPATLVGKPRSPIALTEGIFGAGVYGTGFSTVVVVGLPGRLGGQTLEAARENGAAEVPLTGAQAYELRATPLAALVVHRFGDRSSRRTWLLTGLVDPQLLRRAAAELVGRA
jgi:hypothetical protein